jgi:hypothetical protein
MEYQRQEYQSNEGSEPTPSKEEDLNKSKAKLSSRKRVSQACDRCRSRKDKCDGKKPACSTCTTHGRTCSYDTNVKKRGLPEGYVRGLEKLWGLAIREVNGVENGVLLVINGEDGSDTFLGDWNDEENSDNLVEAWRKSQISKELERLLSNSEPPSESRKRKHTDSGSQAENGPLFPSTHASKNDGGAQISQSSFLNKPLDIHPKDISPESPNPLRIYSDSNRSLGKDESILSSPYQPEFSSKRSAIGIGSPDLPSEAWHLINVYSSYTHPWLPIIDRQDLQRTSYQYLRKRDDFSISGTGSGNHAVLWAVIAYAKLQHRAINNIPHAQGPVANVVWTAERMYANARVLIPDEEGVFELGHVQALLVLALANMGNGHLSRAWLLIGQAVRIAVDMGLSRPSDDILMALKAPSRTKHVFLGCFILDTVIAARLGYRPHLRSEDVDQVGPVEEEGLDEWDPWTDCLAVCRTSSASQVPASVLSNFNRLVKVIQILNDAVCESDSPRTAQSSTELLEKLHAWSQSQPSLLQFELPTLDSEAAMALLPHHYNLSIAYYNTLATLQSMCHNQRKESSSLEPIARSARQIAELLIQHSNNFGLLIIPPTFEYFVKTAYDVVREVQSSIEDTHINLADWKHSLDIYLDLMEPAWPIFESFKSSISYQTPATGRRESQVAFELISGMNQMPDTPQTALTPNSLSSYDTTEPRVWRHQPAVPANNISHQAKAMVSQASHQTRPFGLLSGHPFMANADPDGQSLFNTENFITAGSRPAKVQGSRINNVSNIATSPPHILHRMSMNSEIELDPMFQEFAALDATEWYSNYSSIRLLLTLSQGR